MASRLKLLQEQLTFLKNHNATKQEIENVEKQIARSKRGKSSKAKGSSYERVIAKKIMDKFPVLDLARTPSSGGFQKSSNNEEIRGDISNLNSDVKFVLHIECKNHAKWNLPSWIKQANDDCPEGKIPMVVFHQQQLNEDGKRTQVAEDYVCLKLEDFLDIVQEDSVIKELLKNGSSKSK